MESSGDCLFYNPEQNGTAERKNRTLLDMARCLFIQSGLLFSFWAEAVSTANFITNRCSTKLSLKGLTPYKLWTGNTSKVDYFNKFGYKVLCLNRVPGKEKFNDRTRESIFF